MRVLFALRFVVPCCALLIAVPAKAQLGAAAGLGALVQRQMSPSWRPATALGATARFDRPWAQLAADGVIVGSSDGFQLDRGLVDAALMSAPAGPLRFTLDGSVERFAPGLMPAQTAITLESAMSLAIGAGGIWLGPGVERGVGGGRATTSRAASFTPTARAGAWQRLGNVVVSVNATSHSFRFGGRGDALVTQAPESLVTDSGVVWIPGNTQHVPGGRSRLGRWSDFELRGAWSHGRAGFDIVAGLRPAIDSLGRSVWASVGATLELAPRLALTAGVGTEPSRVNLGVPTRRYARLGLRVAPASLLRPRSPTPVHATAAGFAIGRGDAGQYVVTVRAPRARTVELSGDFDAWTPIALRQTRPDVWMVTLNLAPGTYRMNVRVDGGKWTAPPGTPTVADEFNGTVGIVVVAR